MSSFSTASLSREQDVKNPHTKGSSFSAQLSMTETASLEAAGDSACKRYKEARRKWCKAMALGNDSCKTLRPIYSC